MKQRVDYQILMIYSLLFIIIELEKRKVVVVVLQAQESFNISSYTDLYDMIIPKDNFLRRLNDVVDFTFILDELKDKYCHDNGRGAIPPIRMFKYLLLKRIYDLSDVDVVERARYDMSFKYFLDLAPEDPVIEPSSLTKFRKLRLKDKNLLDLLVQKTVEIAQEQGVIDSRAIIVDATHTASRYCSKSADEFLKDKAKLVRKAVYQFDETMKEKFPTKPTQNDVKETTRYCETLIETIEQQSDLKDMPSVKEKMNYLKEVLDDCTEQEALSNDPDARIGHKTADSSFFGYKTHLALSKERIITAATITTGEKSDGKYLKELVQKSKDAGMEVDTVIGDTAYSGTDNLKFANKEQFQLVSKLHPVITDGKRKNSGFEFNKDADMFVCPNGHMATKKLMKRRKNRNTQLKYFFDVEKCKVCPLRDGCYKEGAKTKTYSVTVKSTEHKEQEAFQQSEIFKEIAKDRYMIEAKNSELKNRHGYDQATDSGLFGMEIQGATTIFAANLKRIIKLIDEKE
jgi:IS5 family transposase